MVDGGLVNYGSGVVGFDTELKPCPSRQPHLGTESQQPTLFYLFHAPPIDGIANVNFRSVRTSAAYADDADK